MIDSLEYNDYAATIHYNSEDEVFFGKIIGINDLLTFEGSSVEELKTAFRETIDDYLETCKSLGKTPDKTYKGAFNVRIPSKLHKKAVFIASKNNVSLNDFIKTALIYAVKHEQDINTELSNKDQSYNSALEV